MEPTLIDLSSSSLVVPTTERLVAALPALSGQLRVGGANSLALASLWADFIDWEKRRSRDGAILSEILTGHGCRRVFDAALGDGCDAVHLSHSGFNVHGNEIDSVFRRLALTNIGAAAATVKVHAFDWAELPRRFDPGSFDAVLCLGNSLTLLLNPRERHAALRSFWHILRPNGLLLVDERNYQYMLDFRRDVLSGRFEYRHEHVYCGTAVETRPLHVSDDLVMMQYRHGHSGNCGHLALYPFGRGQLASEVSRSGFRIEQTLGDYCVGRVKEADFFLHVAVKRPD